MRAVSGIVLIAAECALVTLSACWDTSGPERTLMLSGRLERGSVVNAVVSDGSALTQVTFSPASAATVQLDGKVKLLAAGHLVVTATLANQSQLSTAVDVALIPRATATASLFVSFRDLEGAVEAAVAARERRQVLAFAQGVDLRVSPPNSRPRLVDVDIQLRGRLQDFNGYQAAVLVVAVGVLVLL